MEEHILPLLHISSEYKGLVKINESVAGETKTAGITTPVTPNGTFYLTFLPLENPKRKMLLPFTRKLTIGKNMECPSDDGCLKICAWPDNVYEIEINPPYYYMPDDMEVYYKEFVSFEFYMNQKQYNASIIKEYNCYMMIEETIKKRTVYAYPLGFDVESAKISLQKLGEAPYLLADGISREGAFAAIIQLKPEMKAITSEVCESFEAGAEHIVITGKNKRNDYKTIKTYGLYENEICLIKEEGDLMQKEARTVEDTVREFLFCMQNNFSQKAMDYLTMSLKDGLSYSDLQSFFRRVRGDIAATCAAARLPRDYLGIEI